MKNGENFRAKYDLKELELNSLLEITQAINDNLPEDKLYKIYDFTIRGNLNIKKLALYVLDDHWECKVNFGTEVNFSEQPFDEHIAPRTSEFDPDKNVTIVPSRRSATGADIRDSWRGVLVTARRAP